MARSKPNPNHDPSKAPPRVRCPVTREQFLEEAAPLKVNLAGKEVLAAVKEFSTGSLGWFVNEKFVTTIGGVEVKCQANMNITIVGSKEIP